MFVLYVIAAARSTIFEQDSFNRLECVYDTHVTIILKVFIKMLHLHGMLSHCLLCSSVVVNIPMEISALQGWAGLEWVGVWDRKIEDVLYSTYNSIPDEKSPFLRMTMKNKMICDPA